MLLGPPSKPHYWYHDLQSSQNTDSFLESDVQLIALLEKVFRDSGRPLEVKVGKTAFEV